MEPRSTVPAGESTTTTYDRLVELLTTTMGTPDGGYRRETRFREDMEADSLDTVQMVCDVEDEFGVDILDEVAEQWRTVGDVERWLEANPGKAE